MAIEGTRSADRINRYDPRIVAPGRLRPGIAVVRASDCEVVCRG